MKYGKRFIIYPILLSNLLILVIITAGHLYMLKHFKTFYCTLPPIHNYYKSEPKGHRFYTGNYHSHSCLFIIYSLLSPLFNYCLRIVASLLGKVTVICGFRIW
jgi:hypothetical protein